MASAPSWNRASLLTLPYRCASQRPKRKFIIADTPGPRAIHAQHGDRRFDRQKAHHHSDRRAQRRVAAVAPPCVYCESPRHPALCCRRQQNGPRRFQRRRLSRDSGRVHRFPAPHPARLPTLSSFRSSARDGDNVVTRSDRTPWYSGPALLEFLEDVAVDSGKRNLFPPASRCSTCCARISISAALPARSFRQYFGKAISCSRCLPASPYARIERIVTYDGDLKSAVAPQVRHALSCRRNRHQPGRHDCARA